MRSRIAVAALFLLAVALLLTGTIGGIRAAPLVESPFLTASVGMSDIGVTLLENGSPIGWRDYGSTADGSWNERRGNLLANLLGEGEFVKLGYAYPETLTVQNSGSIDIYVRVSLYCYWQDADGNKLQLLSPETIRMALCTDDGWVVDEASSTAERTVLYYTKPLPSGELTPECTESLTIDPAIRSAALLDGTLLRASYDGVSFRVEAEVDAVQTHNAEAAIWSAWGRRVTVTDGILRLN